MFLQTADMWKHFFVLQPYVSLDSVFNVSKNMSGDRPEVQWFHTYTCRNVAIKSRLDSRFINMSCERDMYYTNLPC